MFGNFGTDIRLAHLPIFGFRDWDMRLHHRLVGRGLFVILAASTSRDSTMDGEGLRGYS